MRQIIAILFLASVSQTVHAQLADGYLDTWVTTRSEELNRKFSSRPLDSIGWANTIQEALFVARQNDRPVFMFTLDGHMATGRC